MGGIIDGEDNWEEHRKWAKEDVCCGRCYLPIPFEDKDLYEESGICGWCVQMMRHDN